MDQPNNQDCCCLNEHGGCCCCPPMTEESDVLKKLKPILTIGLVVYCILLVLDLCLLNNGNFLFFLFFIFAVSFLIYNRCFIIFQFYTLACIFLIFGTALPEAGIIIQKEKLNIKESKEIVKFCIYVFIIIFSIIFYYFTFEAYKEMKYLFETRAASNPQLIPSYMVSGQSPSNNSNSNSNYVYRRNDNNDDNNNNNNNKQNKGFKAFSGKGYKVGGS